MGNVSNTLIAERETLVSSKSGSNRVSGTAFSMILTLSSTELDVSSSLHWTVVLFEVHSLESSFGVRTERTFGETGIWKVSLFTALHESLIWSHGSFALEGKSFGPSRLCTEASISSTGITASTSSRANWRWWWSTSSSTNSRCKTRITHRQNSNKTKNCQKILHSFGRTSTCERKRERFEFCECFGSSFYNAFTKKTC